MAFKKQGGQGNNQPRQNFALPIIAAFLALFVLAALAFVLFYHLPSPVPQQRAVGEITLVPAFQKVSEGQSVKFTAYSSCGEFSVSGGAQETPSSGLGKEFSIPLPIGSHTIIAANKDCNASAQVEVVRRECGAGETQSCEESGCAGTRSCEASGIWGECSLPPRKCTPGARIGCAFNACSFGYTTCNKCGTGFGECIPEGKQGSEPLNANSASCG